MQLAKLSYLKIASEESLENANKLFDKAIDDNW